MISEPWLIASQSDWDSFRSRWSVEDIPGRPTFYPYYIVPVLDDHPGGVKEFVILTAALAEQLLTHRTRTKDVPWLDIKGVEIDQLNPNRDSRGWLVEFWRNDEVEPDNHPQMGYVSLTLSGEQRGPHEHRYQSDRFLFLQDCELMTLYLWDNRKKSDTYLARSKVRLRSNSVTRAIIPPGVVHAYRNCGRHPATIINTPNKLYRGPGREEEVDEIRYEEQEDHPFHLW